MTRFIARTAAAALAVSLAACGGHSGAGSALPSISGTTPPVTSPKNATAKIVVTIPAHVSSSAKRPAYISASTKSMTIGLLSGSSTTQLAEVDLTPTSPNCTALSGGGTQCTAGVVANAGAQTFVLKMYDQTGAKGNLLSSGNAAATLVAGENTDVPLVLDGVPTSVSLVLGTSTLPVGSAGSTSLIVQAKDADGNIIVGPGGFTTPVTLSISGDTYKTLSLSATSVTQPGQAVTLSYTGGTNVGSTITPSLGSTAGTPATFAGTGGAITQIATDLAIPSGYNGPYPADVAALPGGKAGVLLGISKWVCCSPTWAWALGAASTAGYQNYYVGDTTDPFNPSNATSPLAGESGVTVVKGMSLNLVGWSSSGEQEHTLVSDGNGNLYYGASFSSTAANDGCAGGTLSSGVIGVFDPSAGTTKEYVLKGVPQYMRIDNSGNVWFVEKSGTCNGANLLASGWGIGELTAGSTVAVETDFATAGIAANANPYAMTIAPDGTSMFIADDNNHTIIKVATAAMTSTTVNPVHTTDIYAIAAGPDGTLYWMSDNYSNYNYYYGYIEGSKPFATANVQEALFPVPDFYGYDAVYADGSYWGAGYDNYGFGRTSGLATGSPQIQFYPTTSLNYAEPYSLAAGSGYIWATDDDYDTLLALQYGAQSTTTMTLDSRKAMQSSAGVNATINSWRRIGTFSSVPARNPRKQRMQRSTETHA